MGSSVAVVEMLVPLIGRCAAVDDTVSGTVSFEQGRGRMVTHFRSSGTSDWAGKTSGQPWNCSPEGRFRCRNQSLGRSDQSALKSKLH